MKLIYFYEWQKTDSFFHIILFKYMLTYTKLHFFLVNIVGSQLKNFKDIWCTRVHILLLQQNVMCPCELCRYGIRHKVQTLIM